MLIMNVNSDWMSNTSSDLCMILVFITVEPLLVYTNTLGTKIIVLISEVSLFQGKNIMYLYKVATQPGMKVSLFQSCP